MYVLCTRLSVFQRLLRPALPLLAIAAFPTCPTWCQTPPATPDQTQNPALDADGKIVDSVDVKPKTPAELKDQAWSMLSAGITDQKKPEVRIQTLAALGQMGSNPRSTGMIRTAMSDKDVDVRLAAAVSAGQTRSPLLTTDLRRLLDDKEPAVAFTAALTLWKMHDRSGEDILTAVADGDRKTVPGLLDGTEHNISKELHDPAAMARLGAMEGASILLGPFGMGITAFEYVRKNGGDGARVTAIEAIAQNHTAPIKKELLGATVDKDLGVRAAACKALARYRDPDVPPTIARVFDDPKPPVRLTAAASYLISSGAVVGSPLEDENASRGKTH